MTNTTVRVANALSVPVCKVSITSTSDPSATHDNMRMSEAILSVGEEKDLLYKASEDGNTNYTMTVFRCASGGNIVGDKLTEIPIDVTSGSVTIH